MIPLNVLLYIPVTENSVDRVVSLLSFEHCLFSFSRRTDILKLQIQGMRKQEGRINYIHKGEILLEISRMYIRNSFLSERDVDTK